MSARFLRCLKLRRNDEEVVSGNNGRLVVIVPTDFNLKIMACNFQRLAVQQYGEKKVKILGEISDFDLDHRVVRDRYGLDPLDKVFFIPCGQCVECRLQKSRDMANRIYLETKTFSENWAVTLTYDDIHLPFGKEVLDGEGEYKRYPTLVPEDVTKFNKAFRQLLERELNLKGIKFYCAGEYGDEHARPHYHLIYMNCPLPADDVSIAKGEFSETGEQLYRSKICERAWSYFLRDQNGKFLRDDEGKKIALLRGRVRLNEVSWQYAAYVARYVMKKQTGQGAEKYDTLGIVPEFTRCSTREGIGKRYFEENKENLLETDDILVKQGDKTVHAALPRYFLRLAEKEGLDISALKRRRQAKAQAALFTARSQISQDYGDYKREMEEQKKNMMKGLPRKM